mmetsp:Transcript_38502/g.28344  ORF Transcript_38502/g.28344 Transcript_38502/m.28344 type:complete len:138 (+) Transcript_38502:35-448(+)
MRAISRRYLSCSAHTLSQMHKKEHLSAFPEIDRSFMKVLDGEIDTSDSAYQANLAEMLKKNEELDAITAEQMHVNEKYAQLAKKRDKLLPRDRINAIVDKGSPFLELSQLAGYNVNQGTKHVQHGNILTGIGLINGR